MEIIGIHLIKCSTHAFVVAGSAVMVWQAHIKYASTVADSIGGRTAAVVMPPPAGDRSGSLRMIKRAQAAEFANPARVSGDGKQNASIDPIEFIRPFFFSGAAIPFSVVKGALQIQNSANVHLLEHQILRETKHARQLRLPDPINRLIDPTSFV